MNIEAVGIVGAGQMGNGIAQVCAHSGCSVVLLDVSQAALQGGLEAISVSCDRLIKKAQLSAEEKYSLLARIRTTTVMQELANCDLVIEAASEDVALKLRIFRDLDQAVRADALLCTNTSSISITLVAAATQRPENVAGMHFFNPVPVMELVEGIRGMQTADTTFATVQSFVTRLGKTFVAAQDSPGFIVNRILLPMINEAIYACQEGVASVAAIDAAMQKGTNQPLGPLALADLIGLDTCLAILKVLHTGFGDPKYRPCPLLSKYVEAGWIGRKSGRGFYTYADA